MGIRRAGKAGGWYRRDAKGLAEEVGECLELAERDYGRFAPEPGKIPTAAVVPHAGLAFSGAIAATAFRLIRDAHKRVDTFIVFGACHRARLSRPAIWARGEWETPLGEIKIDAGLADRLIEAGVGGDDEAPHVGDNAIELQTPFIKRLFPEAKMVPIAMSFFEDSWRFGEIASRVASEAGGTIVAIASTDLTHYGASFGVIPAGVGESALAWSRQNDARFLDALERLDLEAIVPVAERDASACGAGAAAAVAGWAKARGCGRGRLLAYATSHDIAPQDEADHFVGYAALTYETSL